MKNTITINGEEYQEVQCALIKEGDIILRKVEKKPKVIEKNYRFEVYPHDAGWLMNFSEAKEYAKSLGDGWRLPTKEELNIVYERREEIGGLNLTGSNTAGWYWSSTANGGYCAWQQRFTDGKQDIDDRSRDACVRAVRQGCWKSKMTDQTKAALEALDRVEANRYRYGGATAGWHTDPRISDINIVRAALTNAPEVVTVEDITDIIHKRIDKNLSCRDSDLKLLGQELLENFPNGVKIVEGV